MPVDDHVEPLSADEAKGVDVVLASWLIRTRVALKAYNDATTRAAAAEWRLGIPAIALSALVATGVFATLQSDPELGWRIATGIVAALAAVLTALQTFLRHNERAEQFRGAARGYGRMRRRIEQAQLFPPTTREEAIALLEELAEELDETSIGNPNVARSIWDRAEYLVKGTADARAYWAFLIWIRERLHFGVADGRGPLPEDHERYFVTEGATIVPIGSLTCPEQPDPNSVFEARKRMRRAAGGRRSRRDPLAVNEIDGGKYAIVDGKATFAVALQESWMTIPVRVVVRGPTNGVELEGTE
jgi:hypothetical protein